MEKLTLKYTLTEQEYWDYNKYFLMKSMFSPRKLISSAIVTVLVALYVYAAHEVFFWLFYALYFLFMVTLMTLVDLVGMIFRKRRSNKIFQTHSLLSKETTRIITKEGLTTYRKNAEFFDKWEDIETTIETKLTYTVHTPNGLAVIIPKSAFKTEDEEMFFLWCTVDSRYKKKKK